MNFEKTKFIIILFLITLNIESQADKSTNNDACLPDLKVNRIDYKILKHSKPKPKPGIPQRRGYYGSPRAIRFLISIENIGTLDWDNDLLILYQFDEKTTSVADTIVLENFLIPYALKETIELEIKHPSRKPKYIRFYLNTTKTDSIDYYKIFDEFYYKNNFIEVNLN